MHCIIHRIVLREVLSLIHIYWETKTNISYAVGDEADFTSGGKEAQYRKWASDGYLEPIPEEAYTGDDCVLKDWKALWSKEDFNEILSLAKNSDGKLYYCLLYTSHLQFVCEVYLPALSKNLLHQTAALLFPAYFGQCLLYISAALYFTPLQINSFIFFLIPSLFIP